MNKISPDLLQISIAKRVSKDNFQDSKPRKINKISSN